MQRLILCAAAVLSGGCYSVFTAETEAVPLNADQLTAIKGMDPAVALAAIKAMQGTTFVDGIDFMTQADRSWNKSISAAGVRTYAVTANHRTDAEAINALGQQVNALAQSLAPLAQAALKVAVVAPVPAVAPPPTAGQPQPVGGVPTVNTGGPWLATDLLQLQSVNMKRAFSLAGVATPPYGVRASTADESARFAAGKLMLGEFLAICGPNWAADPRVRD